MKQRDWYLEYRTNWIMEMLDIYGFINREHLIRKFGISAPQSAIDFRRVMETHPGAMAYNVSTRRYEKINGPEEITQKMEDHHVRLRRRAAPCRNGD